MEIAILSKISSAIYYLYLLLLKFFYYYSLSNPKNVEKIINTL